MANLVSAIVPNWQSAPQPIRHADAFAAVFLLDFARLAAKNRRAGAGKAVERGKIAV
jgi:hypothetical protein